MTSVHVDDGKKNAVISLFITGGTGFFGRSILRRFISLHDEANTEPPKVTVLTRSTKDFLHRFPEFSELSWLSFHDGNVLSMDTFPQVGSFTHILHAAADSTVGPQLALLDRFEQIVSGTRNVLNFAVKGGVKRMLLTSSGGVYGAQPVEMDRIPESYMGMPDPLRASNTYGVSKRMAEHLCALYSDKYGIETVIARCFAFTGPDLPLDAHFAIGNFIRDAMNSSEIVVNGNGSPVRSYLYQDDLADWLMTLLEKGESSHAYNVGSDRPISIQELAYMVRDILSPKTSVHIIGDSSSDDAVRNRYVPDINKVTTEFDLRVNTPLENAIRLTAMNNNNMERG